ncbi:hypothetical protein P5V15_006226 [Pogonomyrmex californicus]
MRTSSGLVRDVWTTSGRDVYVHALHAFLDRFLHCEAPRGSGEHPKTEHAGVFPLIRNHAAPFFFPSPRAPRRRCTYAVARRSPLPLLQPVNDTRQCRRQCSISESQEE